MNKKGYSTGFSWAITLIALLVIGLLYIVFNQVMITEIIPISDSLLNSSPYLNASELADATSYKDKGIAYWSFVKYIMFFVIILYLVFAVLRAGGGEEYTQ